MTQRDEDAVWRTIVENYGDRVQLEELEPPVQAPVQAPTEQSAAVEGPTPVDYDDASDHFVPPEPPPFVVPEPPRLIAWAGVVGVPIAAILLAVLAVVVPSWAGVLGLAWFVGGFGYLVATMRHDEDDDHWDDGAVL